MYFSQATLQQLKRIQARLNRLDPDALPLALTAPGTAPPRGTIVVFPGSFNPPTTAHLALLKDAQRAMQQQPAKIYAAFSKHTVDKESVERPLLLERVHLLDMLLRRRLRHAGILLFNRGLYVEEAEAIHTSFPGVHQLFFLIGFDKLVQIFDPRYYADRDAALSELFALAKLLAAPRGNGGEREIAALLQQPHNQRFARFVRVLPFDPQYRATSSTHARQGDMSEVPHEVQQFIRETRAYAPPLQKADGTQCDYYGERIRLLQELLSDP
jgi:nicotinic acid mononucleotide adenylyltransferase